MTALQMLTLAPLPALTIVAALRDATTMTIPNWLSLALLALFLPAALVAGQGVGEFGVAVLLFAAALAAGMVMFALNWIGGGDAKLLAAVAPWMGVPGIGRFVLFTALAGGALSILLLAARRVAPAFPMGPSWLSRLLEPKGDVPYGLAIAAGALLAYPDSALVQAAAAG